ncbi:hypothetical protein A2982_03325 [candidate division WWE3 bacterium RIFCSPLOWO2_01_FULL_39_13]|uniref:Uncharacterized protein n=1 Tax=candidate division WWE3 bacterium RIFCSPLOWO2_01_FULL_39_13 TaxID=1802624 RepID=A0A1F4V3B5_UNCKA|nr:MAG: hypothetical protein A2982_03325 [candidate division WWE3 bacterium RIFCSPLOWO2_01_FULL_39_13]
MDDKDYLSIALVVIALLAVGLFAFSIIRSQPTQDEGSQSETVKEETPPAESVPPVASLTPVPSDESSMSENSDDSLSESDETDPALEEAPDANADKESIALIFSQKYNKPIEEVNVEVSENTGEFAKGVISFEGEMGGGSFLATKTDDTWKIVADGNGVIMCDLIEPYNFPVSVVPECYDQALEKIVER